jgi:Domain of unknown function (DUF1963)
LSHVTRQSFPYWPVEPIRLRLPADLQSPSEDCEINEEIYEAQNNALHALVTPREFSFSVYSSAREGIESSARLWWYGANHVLLQLKDSLEYRDDAIALRRTWIAQAQDYQARLATEAEPNQEKIDGSRKGEEGHTAQIENIKKQAEGLAEFVQHFGLFVADRDAWTEMTSEEIDTLQEVLDEARERFPELCTFRVPMKTDDLRNLCIRRMMTGDEKALNALPDEMLDFINENYRLPSGDPHQMFGLGGCQQTALYDHLCDHLLLQLGPDDMPEMIFGDMGLWQFWISPEDLAAQRFDKTQLTFECG